MVRTSIGRIIWFHLTLPERRKLILIWVLILVGMILEILSLGMVLPLIAVLTDSSEQVRYKWFIEMLGAPSQEWLVLFVVSALFVVFLIKNVFSLLSTRFQRSFLNKISARLSQQAFSTYLRQPYEFHLHRNSSVLINNAEIAKSIVSGGLEPFLTLLTDGLVAIGLFVLLIFVEPVGSSITLLAFGLTSSIFQLATRKRIVDWGTMRKKNLALVLMHLQQGLGGVKEVKLLAREKSFIAEHEKYLSASMDVDRRFLLLQALPKMWFEVVAVASLTVLVFTMAFAGNSASEILPVIGLFAATAFRIIPSAGRILASVQGITYFAPQIRSVHEDLLLEFPTEDQDSPDLIFNHEISIENLHFSYEHGHREALAGINLKIRRGESVGIIGTSGAGKSTLVDVLLGLLNPQIGKVCVDKVPIQSNMAGWHRLVGYVPQSIYLVDDSIARNIAFGIEENCIDRSRVFETLQLAQLLDFVNSLPDGIDSVVGERGVRLSGGQRQRIGIARALYENPEVLVLDEATSALDHETESDVMRAVKKLQDSKTVVIVAHRLSTVESCSRIVRIENGVLEELPSQGKSVGV